MTVRFALAAVLALSGCYAETEPPPEFAGAPDHLRKAMKEQRTVADVLPTVTPRPRLVAEAVASTGQSMALYEYRPFPPSDRSEAFVSLRFANDTLVSVGSRARTTGDSWLARALAPLLADKSFTDPYGPERVADCVEALEESVYVRTHRRSQSSSRSC